MSKSIMDYVKDCVNDAAAAAADAARSKAYVKFADNILELIKGL